MTSITPIISGIIGVCTLLVLAYLMYWLYSRLMDMDEPTNWIAQISSLFQWTEKTDRVVDLSNVERQLPIDVQPNERIVYTNYKLTHGVIAWTAGIIGVVLLLTILFSPIGFLLLVVAYRMRKQPTYVFTDKQLYVIANRNVQIYDYEQVAQLQTGSAIYERIFGRGHIKFSLGETGLEQIFGVANHKEVSRQIAAVS